MKKYLFHLVNVFAEARFGGNPLAVFPNADGLTDDEMQAIARQFNLSETVFLLAGTDGAAADLRIFTPNYELPLAGHPTLGSAFVLSHLADLPSQFVLNTRAKPVTVQVHDSHVQMQIAGYQIKQAAADKADLATACGIDEQDITDHGYFINSGTQQLLIELTNFKALQNLNIDKAALRLVNEQNPYRTTDEPSVYCWFEDSDTVHSRMFFEQGGVMVEDSGTGSACANLGAYFIHQHRTPIAKQIHQGDDMGRPNRLSLSVDEGEHIYVGGNVIAVGRGEFYLT